MEAKNTYSQTSTGCEQSGLIVSSQASRL